MPIVHIMEFKFRDIDRAIMVSVVDSLRRQNLREGTTCWLFCRSINRPAAEVAERFEKEAGVSIIVKVGEE